jgi:hypothetical protein
MELLNQDFEVFELDYGTVCRHSLHYTDLSKGARNIYRAIKYVKRETVKLVEQY